MQTAGAHALREDSDPTARSGQPLEREGPRSLERDRTRRFERERTGRFERHDADRVRAARVHSADAERRTVTITGRPHGAPPRRRSTTQEQLTARPDRIALWAFLLGLFLVLVAAATANAAAL